MWEREIIQKKKKEKGNRHRGRVAEAILFLLCPSPSHLAMMVLWPCCRAGTLPRELCLALAKLLQLFLESHFAFNLLPQRSVEVVVHHAVYPVHFLDFRLQVRVYCALALSRIHLRNERRARRKRETGGDAYDTVQHRRDRQAVYSFPEPVSLLGTH